MNPAWRRLATVLSSAGLLSGVAGCYIPGGGWTLRTGVDVRQIRKPAAFLEMVDTKWDEWNRVSQYNLCEYGSPVPTVMESGMVGTPSNGALTPLATPPGPPPAGDQPVSPRGTEGGTVPPASSVPDTPNSQEATPLPPAPGNTSASGMRHRVRRRQEVYDVPGAASRSALLPVSAQGYETIQYAEAEDLRYDRGPVTLDFPQIDSYSSNHRPMIRSNAQLRGTSAAPRVAPARTAPQGAWVFSRP